MSNEQMDMQTERIVNGHAQREAVRRARRMAGREAQRRQAREEAVARLYRDYGIFYGMLAGVMGLGALWCLYRFAVVGAILCAVAFGGLLWAARWYWGRVW